ncbi:type IV secretory system conjugative DNA transfer family protein [Nocardiopsis lambiniae]|uniref:Type IV secretory system conjugative DNA transfer family protein n=1 Tax=Nocardiopsis lambiniae TaxID=3075539 RepID=A0ABU2MEA8_9ACTN|nr:type IV secretory system conjugative DNA transfer family protein [Nocardiopsis sp. DSM 44743]MDT0330894.1 type IV secretory system conjugative DNA transfer family protein [Nocardiopsis sp. DSM 44743]
MLSAAAKRPPLAFAALHLPRPLEEKSVGTALERIVAEPGLSPVVLEARADAQGVRHLLGVRVSELGRVRRLLGDLFPGAVLVAPKAGEPVLRSPMTAAARLRLRPTGLPLRSDMAEVTTRALLSAFAVRLTGDEAVAVQVVLGPRRSPRLVPSTMDDPGVSWWHLLTKGTRPADAELRSRLKERLGQVGVAATIRLGATGGTPERRRHFVMSLLGALTTAQGPGVRLELVREAATRFNKAQSPRFWPLSLGVSELVGLLAWPLGEGELPGLPPLHPKPLRASPTAHTGSRVFAQSAAPGDERLLGIGAKDQTFHAVAYGPSGSGKTNALLHLILADVEAGRPVVVLDPKRQLIDDILARLPEHRVGDVVELNAADASPVGFNPLDVTGRDPDVVVDGILAVFQAVFADGWGPRTADIFSAGLRTLARASRPETPATLVDLLRLFTDAAFRRSYVGRLQGDVALAGFWAWYEDQSPASQAAAIAPPLNKLRQFLLRPALIQMLDQRADAFRLRDVFKSNKIVLVPLNEALIGPGTASLLGSLIIAEVWQATQERANETSTNQEHGVVYIDEAPRFLNLPVSLADALAVSRSLGVGWFLASQFRDQFPPSLKSAVDINARSKIQFATEHGDAQAAAKLAPSLTAEDFMALPRFHAYTNLVADGAPSGWALVKTLPPPPVLHDATAMRARVRANFAPPPVEEPAAEAPTPLESEQVADQTPPHEEHNGERIGRKRRRRGKR